jgi:glutamate/tyrosine decarboxylase-like PLP-dependent enzyme
MPEETLMPEEDDARAPDVRALLARAMDAIDDWEAGWGDYDPHPSLGVAPERLDAAIGAYLDRLTADPEGQAPGNYPFFHPRYAGQMLKPPHPVATAAYAAAQRINPNNHALDGGPPTGQMEKEVIGDLAAMLGLPSEALGHLTGGGTVANLEALWVARELAAPGQKIAVSEAAHYTHSRMAGVLGVETLALPTDDAGRMDLGALEDALADGAVGTVVATPGTTGRGAVDPLPEIVPLCRRHGARLHADAAYGGFFALLSGEDAMAPEGFPKAPFRALAACDSVAIDPHKHGLQPYGCGAVLFRDPDVGRFYQHDSPYTYFTSDALHLGEISLECSRAGAAAGALWLTLRCLPLEARDGLGPVLGACLRAARRWAARIEASGASRLLSAPETDILCFFPEPRAATLSAVDRASRRVFDWLMGSDDDPVFLSLYRVSAETLRARFPDLDADQEEAAVLRSVLMKPEHENEVERLHGRVAEACRAVCS